MFNFTKFASFLKSFWGILASLMVVTPTIVYLLKGNQIELSCLSGYYVSIGTIVALLVIPFTFLYEQTLNNNNKVGRCSAFAFLVGIILFFGFIIVKNVYVVDTRYTVTSNEGYTRVQISESKNGLVQLITYDQSTSIDNPLSIVERPNKFEILAVFLFVSFLLCFTAAFSILGVFYYNKSKA